MNDIVQLAAMLDNELFKRVEAAASKPLGPEEYAYTEARLLCALDRNGAGLDDT